MVLLAAMQSIDLTRSVESLHLSPSTVIPASDGHYLSFGDGQTRILALLGSGQSPFALPTALIPFDDQILDRMSAADRLIRHGQGRRAPDTRLTTQKRKRLVQMLRAADARADGASHRQIAEALFGRRRVRAELWHESSLRYATLRLVRDGVALIDGGYRDLLRIRRRR